MFRRGRGISPSWRARGGFLLWPPRLMNLCMCCRASNMSTPIWGKNFLLRMGRLIMWCRSRGLSIPRTRFAFWRRSRVLKPGGVIFLTTPNVSLLQNRLLFLITGSHDNPPGPIRSDLPNLFMSHINLLPFQRLEAFFRFGLYDRGASSLEDAAGQPISLLSDLSVRQNALCQDVQKKPCGKTPGSALTGKASTCTSPKKSCAASIM